MDQVLTKQWTIVEALNWTEQRLARAGEENPRLAAQILAAQASGLSRIELYTNFDKPLSECERTVLRESIQRRLDGEPLQYIAGRTGFRYVELMVRSPVAIPRPETEVLVGLVLQHITEYKKTNPCILDIGTGTGAIALALLFEVPDCQIIATDIDETAIELASENALELMLDDAEHLQLYRDDLASSLLEDRSCHGRFDVVVSNPPYIPTAEYEQLPAEIRHFESRRALEGGADGLAVFRRLAEQAVILLKPGGLLAVELHENALEEAVIYAQSLSFEQVQISRDLTGRDRFLTSIRGEL